LEEEEAAAPTAAAIEGGHAGINEEMAAFEGPKISAGTEPLGLLKSERGHSLIWRFSSPPFLTDEFWQEVTLLAGG
jgi:hypothetical protein